MSDVDDIKQSLTEIKAALAHLTDGQWDLGKRVNDLEAARAATPSRADVGAGDMQLASDMGLMKAELTQMIVASANAGESRGGENRALFLALGILVVVAGLVAHGDIQGTQFVGSVVSIGVAFGGWVAVQARKRYNSSGSLRPAKKGILP